MTLNIKTDVTNTVSDTLLTYPTLIGGLVIGIVVGVIIKGTLLNRRLYQQYEKRFEDKEQTIRDLNSLLLERAEKLESEKLKDNFLNKMRKLLRIRSTR